MTEYYLPRHVHFCCRGEALVFLDLKQDDYILVDGDTANALRNLLSKAPADKSRSGLVDPLKVLLEGGLLTTDRCAGKDVVPTRIDVALDPLVDPEDLTTSHINIGHIYAFVSACTKALVQLRLNEFEDIVETVRQRKAQHLTAQHIDLDAARELTSVFRKLRLFFPRNYLCLYDSLALIEFLARYHIFPTWVFGISLEPWAAHCWLQEGQFIINEGVEEAANYTPVMTI